MAGSAFHAESPASKDTPARKGDVIFLTPDMFAQQNDPYFKTNGFFERSIAKRVEEFGNLVEVWSTFESRDAKDDAKPFSRGINSFQIVRTRGRFWIASLLFDSERPGLTLPPKYLTTAGYDESTYQSPATAIVMCTPEASLPDPPSWRMSDDDGTINLVVAHAVRETRDTDGDIRGRSVVIFG
jgi:hypothetical protein